MLNDDVFPYRSFPKRTFSPRDITLRGDNSMFVCHIDSDGNYTDEEYIPRATYLAAEKEIEKLHELNWKLEKTLMEERGYVLSADGERWIRFVNSYVLNHPVILESIPVGEVIG